MSKGKRFSDEIEAKVKARAPRPKRVSLYRRFFIVPIPLWLARRKEVTQGAKLVYGRLAGFATKKTYAFPSTARIADEIGISPRQAIRCINELVSFGLIERVRRGRPGGGYQSTVYYFLEHEWFDLLRKQPRIKQGEFFAVDGTEIHDPNADTRDKTHDLPAGQIVGPKGAKGYDKAVAPSDADVTLKRLRKR